MSDVEIEKMIVNAIQKGVKNAKIAKENNGDEIDNAEPFKKVDKIVNAVKQKFDEAEGFETYILLRRRYKILLAYDRKNRILYSVMGEERLTDLLTSNNIDDKKNYLFGLILFNNGKEMNRQQQIIGPEFEAISEVNNKINEEVRNIIDEERDLRYYTVVYNCFGYALTSVRKIAISKFEEIVKDKDLSEYINMVDYEETYKNGTDDTNEDIPFTMKKEYIINKNTNNSDVKIEFNKEEKMNEK